MWYLAEVAVKLLIVSSGVSTTLADDSATTGSILLSSGSPSIVVACQNK